MRIDEDIEHTLVLGITRTGKSYLAQQHCADWREQWRGERHTAVLDPKLDAAKWGRSRGKHLLTADPSEFVRAAWSVKNAMLYFDECGDYLQYVTKENQRLAQLITRGSGNGHRCFLIAQRHVQIAPTVRNQCVRLYLFHVPWQDARALAADFSDPLLEQAPKLQKRQYIFKRKMEPAVFRAPLKA